MSKRDSYPDELITLREAAVRCGLSPTTLRVLIRNSRLNAVKRGRDWFTTEAYREAYLASRSNLGGYQHKTGRATA